MKEPDPLGDFKKVLLRTKLEEIVAMPATLYFPTGIVAQLNEVARRARTQIDFSLRDGHLRAGT